MRWPSRSTISWRRPRRRKASRTEGRRHRDDARRSLRTSPRDLELDARGPRRRDALVPRCCCSCRRGSSGSRVFILYPMVASLYFSFTHYDLLGAPIWIGLDNYKSTCSPRTPCSGRRCATRCGSSWSRVPLQIVFAIVTATLLTKPRRGVKVYRTMYFLPDDRPAGGGVARLPVPVQPGVRRR